MSNSSQSGGSLSSRLTGKLGSTHNTRSSLTEGASTQSSSSGQLGSTSLLATDNPHDDWPEWDVSPTVDSFFHPPTIGPEPTEPNADSPTNITKGYILAIQHILAQLPKTFLEAVKEDLHMEGETNSNHYTPPGDRTRARMANGETSLSQDHLLRFPEKLPGRVWGGY